MIIFIKKMWRRLTSPRIYTKTTITHNGKEISPEAQKKIDEAFEEMNRAFDKLNQAFDLARQDPPKK